MKTILLVGLSLIIESASFAVERTQWETNCVGQGLAGNTAIRQVTDISHCASPTSPNCEPRVSLTYLKNGIPLDIEANIVSVKKSTPVHNTVGCDAESAWVEIFKLETAEERLHWQGIYSCFSSENICIE